MPSPVWRGLRLLVALLVLLPAPAAAQTPSAPCGVVDGQSSAQCTPNLTLQNLNHFPEHPDVRTPTVEMCADVLNSGGTPSAPGVEVVFSLSSGEEWHLTMPHQLVTGQSQTLCVNQSSMGEGDYWFAVHVDPQHQFPESNRDDNDKLCANHDTTLSYPYCFRVLGMPRFNLVLTDFFVSPRIAGPDTTQSFFATVQNQGDANSTATTLTFVDDNGLIATLPVRALGPGEKVNVLTSTNANTRPVGNFTATATVDPGEALHEIRFDDNARSYAYGIKPHALPDLAFLKLPTITGNLTAHRGLRLTGSVINQGERGALRSTLRVFDGDRPIRNFTIPQLLVGQNATFADTLVLGGGEHDIRFVIDADNEVAESSETNNALDQIVDIQGDPAVDSPQANLVVERVNAQPDDPGPDDLVSISLNVRNIGTGPSNATSVRVDVDGVTLATKNVLALKPNALQSYSIAWPDAKVGTHAVNVVVDPSGLVNQSDRSDDTLSTLIVITDPAPPTPTTPEPAPDGAPQTPTPVTPPVTSPVTNVTPPKAPSDALGIARVDVATRAIPGGLKGVLIATLRNNAIEPMGRVTVTFSIDGDVVKDVLVDGIAGAGSSPATTGEIDIPEGNHTVAVEAHLAGSLATPVRSTQTYEAAAGARAVPGPEAPLIVGAIGVAAALVGARRRLR